MVKEEGGFQFGKVCPGTQPQPSAKEADLFETRLILSSTVLSE